MFEFYDDLKERFDLVMRILEMVEPHVNWEGLTKQEAAFIKGFLQGAKEKGEEDRKRFDVKY